VIGAGIVLLGVGAVDLARARLTGRALASVLVVIALALFALAAGADAAVWWFVAAGVGGLWMLTTGVREPSRWGLWPAALVAIVAGAAVSLTGARADQGQLGAVWPAGSPLGAVSLDVAVLLVGCLVFLIESGNVIVRAALRGGSVPTDERATLKGGRLIGPLERVLVLTLTLTGAFTLLAAVLAAKGIVRFPEISRDDVGGSRAEYFLVGSLVSWVTALAAAFLLWWGGAV
jgi:hypothetical protein